MTIVQEPSEFDLFGINPRWVIVEREDATAKRVKLIVSRHDGGNFVEILTLSNFYGDEEQITFNISKLLKMDYDLPNTGSISSFEFDFCEEMIKKYGLTYEELDADDNQLHLSTFEGYAIMGGRDVLENRRYDFYNDYIENRKFLTLQPREKKITKKQPEWLYYPIMDGENLSHRVRVVLNFSDGIGEIITIEPSGSLGYTFEASKGKVIWFSTGFSQLNLSQYETPDKFILSYQVSVTTHQNLTLIGQSEQMSYSVHSEDASWDYRYFLFENGLGGMDTLCTRGKSQVKGKYDRSSRTVTETPNTAYSDHPRRANRPTGIQKVKVNIGWIDRPEREWIEDLQLSQNVWEIQIGQRYSEFVPILITSDNLDIHQDDESLQSASFTYEYPQRQAR